ncbi:MAG: FAD-dependent oxidoreductase [Planctomycetota bacterium]
MSNSGDLALRQGRFADVVDRVRRLGVGSRPRSAKMLRRRLDPDGRVVILGAGPTGLGAAHRLRELGHDRFAIFDRATQVGGLAASFVDPRGFTWDIGGHIQVSHYPYFDELLRVALPGQWLQHQRDGQVFFDGELMPYPFQVNIDRLAPETRWRCISGLLARGAADRAPTDFADWMHQRFGEGICDAFMRPFNEKAWAWPLEQMDYRWIRTWASAKDGSLAAVPDLETTLAAVLRPGGSGAVLRGNANEGTFPFPVRGGTGAIWNAIADRIGRDRVHLGRQATRVDARARVVEFADGSSEPYDVLVSTIPLDQLVALAEQSHLVPHAERLCHAAVYVVGVGIVGPTPERLRGRCWIYFPDRDVPFHRATVFSNYAPANVPVGGEFWSVMTETSASPHKPVDGKALIEATCQALRRVGFVDGGHEIASRWLHFSDYGYPIPTLGRDEALARIHPELARLGIYSRGRFGGWKYEVSNQDQGVMQGVELIDRLLLGAHEVTYWFPHVANDPAYYATGE